MLHEVNIIARESDNRYRVELDGHGATLTLQGHFLAGVAPGAGEIALEFSEDWSAVLRISYPLQLKRASPEEAERRLRLSKAAEARANLKAAYVAERAYQQEKNTFSPQVYEIGFTPERGNRYSYYFAPEGRSTNRAGAEERSDPEAVIVETDRFKFPEARFSPTIAGTRCSITDDRSTGNHGVGVAAGNAGDFLILAAGDLGDGPLDCWTVASFSRTKADGTVVPAGEPCHESDR